MSPIEELKNAKRILENQICNALSDFEKKHGVTVCGLKGIPNKNCDYSVTEVEITVKL